MRGAIEAAAKRIIGFEMQFGPFAVAQLRLIAEIAGADERAAVARASPVHHGHARQSVHRGGMAAADLRADREVATRSEQGQEEEPITVVIGNPPYKEKAEGRGGWIESGIGGKLVAPLDRWRPPPEWGVGAHAKHLKNLYVYFWRWATWKVFGSG